MTRRSVLPPVLLAATAWLAGASPAAAAAAAARAGCPAAATRQATQALTTAQHRYALEARGAAAYSALRKVAADRVLGDAIGAGNLTTANAEASRVVAGHLHITAVRVVRGGRVLVETKRYPFDVAGPRAALRNRRGAVVGTVEVTIQDVIGFIRLVHKYTGAVVVVRGASGQAKSSLPAALGVSLPGSGCATVAGQRYAVGSFTETSFGGEQLTIWILRSG